MGATLTTMILLVGSIVDGVLSSITADRARKKEWTQAKIFGGVSLGTALLLFGLCLYSIVRHSMLNWSGPGVMIAMIFLILTTLGSIIIDGFVFAETISQEPAAVGKAIGSAVLSFGAFIVSLIIIIFLL